MAILTTLRFTPDTGAICVDQESWHIWRRKNWFTDYLYPLIQPELAERFSIEMVYAGVGHPPFHAEVAAIAQTKLTQILSNPETDPSEITIPNLSRLVLEAFQSVHKRRVDDKLNFLFGFDTHSLVSGNFSIGNDTYEINTREVRERALSIVQSRETTGYNPLSPPVESCLIGIDPRYGFSAFVMKEKEGVLSYQSCWFEALGQGRDGAAMRFADLMNEQWLESRRSGPGFEEGLFTLIEATGRSMRYYGQNGGFIRFILLKSSGNSRSERFVDLHDDAARLAFEVVNAMNKTLISRETAADIIKNLIQHPELFDHLESEFFCKSSNPKLLGKFLRGYKIDERDLPQSSPESSLFQENLEGVRTS